MSDGLQDRPRLSVVVAAFSGEAALARCLQSLLPQREIGEIVVATTGAVGPSLPPSSPPTRFHLASPNASVFALRSVGVEDAHGECVALIEDHCTASAGWARALLDAHAGGHAIVGGPVEAASPIGLFPFALHLCEYIAHLPPLAEGPTKILSGLNVSYRRDVLETCHEVWRHAFHENEVHDALRARGTGLLHRASGATVTAHLAFTPEEAMRHLYDGGRHFGEHRIRESPERRLVLRLAAPAVFLILLTRLFVTLGQRRPRWLPLALAALPYETALIGAWSLGEARGYWARVGSE